MTLFSKTSSLYDATLALVFPQRCAVCGASVERRAGGVACIPCWSKTRLFSEGDPICWKCGQLAPGRVPDGSRRDVRCGRCDDEDFSAARACGAYEGALRATILGLKKEPYLPNGLVRLLVRVQQREPLDGASAIVPVPLHSERLRERGFNQATVIARALAQSRGLPLDESSLVRTFHTPRHRAGMDSRARRESVDAAFEVRRPRLIKGERLLLVDDVYTSGATVSACARALRAAGAEEVFVLTIARPVRKNLECGDSSPLFDPGSQ